MAIVLESTAKNTVNAATCTVSKPSGTAEGDLLVALWSARASKNDSQMSTPSGWTNVIFDGGQNPSGRVCYKVAGGSEPSSYDFSLNQTANHGVVICRFSGVDTSSVSDATATNNTQAFPPGSTSAVASSTTTATDAAVVLAMYGLVSSGTVYTISAPSGMSLADGVEDGTSNLSIFYVEQASAGTTGDKTATIENTTGSVSFLWAIKPASESGSTYENSLSVARYHAVSDSGPMTGIGSASLARVQGVGDGSLLTGVNSIAVSRVSAVSGGSLAEIYGTVGAGRDASITAGGLVHASPLVLLGGIRSIADPVSSAVQVASLPLGRVAAATLSGLAIMSPGVSIGRGLGTLGGVSLPSILDDLVAHWSMDESSDGSSATTRNDSHGSNHLTDRNTTASATGILSNGADFEVSNNESLYITDNAALSVGDIDFTFSAWVKLESASATRYILAKGYSTASAAYFQYRLYVSAANKVVWDVSSGSAVSNLQSTESVSAGTWFHVVVYHDSVNNQVGMSLNGGAYKTAAWSGGCYDDIGNFTIGTSPQSNPPSTGSMDGVVDEVTFWKRKLSIDEAQALYNSGSPSPYPFSSVYNSLSISRYLGIVTTAQANLIGGLALPIALVSTGSGLLSSYPDVTLSRLEQSSHGGTISMSGDVELSRVSGMPVGGLLELDQAIQISRYDGMSESSVLSAVGNLGLSSGLGTVVSGILGGGSYDMSLALSIGMALEQSGVITSNFNVALSRTSGIVAESQGVLPGSVSLSAVRAAASGVASTLVASASLGRSSSINTSGGLTIGGSVSLGANLFVGSGAIFVQIVSLSLDRFMASGQDSNLSASGSLGLSKFVSSTPSSGLTGAGSVSLGSLLGLTRGVTGEYSVSSTLGKSLLSGIAGGITLDGSVSLSGSRGISGVAALVKLLSVSLGVGLSAGSSGILSASGSVPLSVGRGIQVASNLSAVGVVLVALLLGAGGTGQLIGEANVSVDRLLESAHAAGIEIDANVVFALYLAEALSAYTEEPATLFIDLSLWPRSLDLSVRNRDLGWTLADRSLGWSLDERSLNWLLKNRSNDWDVRER